MKYFHLFTFWAYLGIAFQSGLLVAAERTHPLGESDAYSIKIDPIVSSKEVRLNVTIRTKSERAEIYLSNLPWTHWYSMVIVVVNPLVGGVNLKQNRLLEGVKPGKISIDESESHSGQVQLSRMFPDLMNQLQEGDLVVFWSYELRTIDD